MPLIDHPMHLAAELAKLLESDPVAVSQIKDHLSSERLIELLEIKPPMTSTVEEAVERCEKSEEDFEDEFRGSATDRFEEDEDAFLELVVKRFTKTEILAAIGRYT